MTEIERAAPAFVTMAHRIVWCTAATVTPEGQPQTRVLHPIWEWNGDELSGWIATSPLSPKARHLAVTPRMSLTYWAADQDTCTADCDTRWENSLDERRTGWERFASAPPPVGYDPSIVPAWTSPEVPSFGILRLRPYRLRIMPGSLLRGEGGETLSWRRR